MRGGFVIAELPRRFSSTSARLRSRAPSFGRHPLIAVLLESSAPGGPAGYCLLFPDIVARHHKCSLPAQFPMKSVDTAATDGLGLVPARPAIVGNIRAQRFAAPTSAGERAVLSMRLSPERFCDDR
jgi:hypothetical protein